MNFVHVDGLTKVFKKISGLDLCFGQTVDPKLLELVTNDVGELRDSVKTWKFESDMQVCEMFVLGLLQIK